MKIVFTWIQWCGKWTQARLLVEKYWYTLVEMWSEFRKIISSWTDLWNEIKKIVDAWEQVNEELWKKVMEEVIKKQTSNKIIYDGFIRNNWNKEIFDRLLPDYKVLFFDLSEEKAKERLLGRMFNQTTWETFPFWTKIDPKTWEELIKRQDDNEEAILTRIEEYMTKTLPIIHMQMNEDKVIEINADQDIGKVFSEIESNLKLK